MSGESIARLKTIIKNIKLWKDALARIEGSPHNPLNNNNSKILNSLGLELSEATEGAVREIQLFGEKIETIKEQIRKQNKPLLQEAQLAVLTFQANGFKDKRESTFFMKAIKYIFLGPDTECKNIKITSTRCERIRSLSPDEVIAWAIAFRPSIWHESRMSASVFDYLLEMLVGPFGVWPQILGELLAKNSLNMPPEYSDFCTRLTGQALENSAIPRLAVSRERISIQGTSTLFPPFSLSLVANPK